MKKSLIFVGMLAVGYANAQTDTEHLGKVGINTMTPKATLEVQPTATNLTGTTNEGLLIPRLSKERVAKMANPETSTLVYVNEATTYTTGTDTAADTRVANVDAVGFYHYNGTQWVKHLDTNTELWAQRDNSGVTETYLKPATANGDEYLYSEKKSYINLGGFDESTLTGPDGFTWNNQKRDVPRLSVISSSTLPSGETAVGPYGKAYHVFNRDIYAIDNSKTMTTNELIKYRGFDLWHVAKGINHNISYMIGHNIGNDFMSSTNVGSLIGGRFYSTAGSLDGTYTPTVFRILGLQTFPALYSGKSTNVIGILNEPTVYGGVVDNLEGERSIVNTHTLQPNETVYPSKTLKDVVGNRISVINRPNSTSDRLFGGLFYTTFENQSKVVNESAGIASSTYISEGSNIKLFTGIGAYMRAESATIENLYGFRFFHDLGSGFSPTNMYGLYLADVNKGSTLNYSIYTNAGQVRLGDLKGIGERIVIADANGVLSTSSVATMGSKWTNDTTNKVVKLTNLSNGTTERTENVGFYIKDNGMVGIGTATPVAPLHIISPSKGYGNDMIIEDYTTYAGDPSGLIFNRNRGTIDAPEVLLENDNVGQIIFATKEGVSNNYAGSRMVEIGANYKETGKGELYISTSGTKRLSIDKDGNVGIGTTSPAERLHINGSVMATSYKGSNGATLFPDYVFQKYYTGNSSIKADYTFKTLSQVEDFVKTNGHLPGYKSAAEIKNQGYIDLMETQLTNVEKIEELYLHSIEQEKTNKVQAEELKTQAQEIETLRKENEELKSRLEKLEKLLK